MNVRKGVIFSPQSVNSVPCFFVSVKSYLTDGGTRVEEIIQ